MDVIGHLNENLTGEATRNILGFLGEKGCPRGRRIWRII